MVMLLIREEKQYNVFINNGRIVVVHFYAEWAEQCSYMEKVFMEISNDDNYRDALFANIPAEEFPQIAMKHKIDAVPTVIIFLAGEELDRVNGANPNLLTTKLTQLLNTYSSERKNKIKEIKSSALKSLSSDAPIEDRLNSLIKAAPVMLFMKGNTDQPRCGFSKQIVQILKDHNVPFKTFDILNDQEVREGLKKLSNWPTYPQLYVHGELIGGLDVVKELVESGELNEMLPKPTTEPLDNRLISLISTSKVFVFMKGNKTQPRCGFSRQLIEILNNCGAPYETFDILEDEEVRQGLKKFSNWPTYPQVYVNGELIGGLDIIKDHQESGELKKILTA